MIALRRLGATARKKNWARLGVPSCYFYDQANPSRKFSKAARSGWLWVTVLPLYPPLPEGFRVGPDGRQHFFGREKEACDQASEASADLSIFDSASAGLPAGGYLSTPFAGRNLHLVISS